MDIEIPDRKLKKALGKPEGVQKAFRPGDGKKNTAAIGCPPGSRLSGRFLATIVRA